MKSTLPITLVAILLASAVSASAQDQNETQASFNTSSSASRTAAGPNDTILVFASLGGGVGNGGLAGVGSVEITANVHWSTIGVVVSLVGNMNNTRSFGGVVLTFSIGKMR